jgi:hypothetical protein
MSWIFTKIGSRPWSMMILIKDSVSSATALWYSYLTGTQFVCLSDCWMLPLSLHTKLCTSIRNTANGSDVLMLCHQKFRNLFIFLIEKTYTRVWSRASSGLGQCIGNVTGNNVFAEDSISYNGRSRSMDSFLHKLDIGVRLGARSRGFYSDGRFVQGRYNSDKIW